MKQLTFSLLAVTLVLLSFKVNAQKFEVFEATGTNTYSNTDISTVPYNILAGQTIHLKVKISETSANQFKVADAAFNLTIPRSFSVIEESGIEYSYNCNPASETTPDIENLTVTGYLSGTGADIVNTFYNTLKVVNAVAKTTDSIVVKKLKIKIPNDIIAGTYKLRLIHSLSGTEAPTDLITFNYETPIIKVDKPASPNCISGIAQCDVSVQSPSDLKYCLFINGEVAEKVDVGLPSTSANPDTVQISNTPLTLDLNYGDKVSIQDSMYLVGAGITIPTDGISNPVTIDESYFNGIALRYNSYPLDPDPACVGDMIDFKIPNFSCFPSADYEFKLYYKPEGDVYKNITNDIKPALASTFKYNPISNGLMKLEVWSKTPSKRIATSNELVIDNVLTLDNTYILAPDIRLSANQDPHNMFNELIVQSGSSFTYETGKSVNFEIPGYDNDLMYFYKIIGEDTLIGRFKFEYDKDNPIAYNIFDPDPSKNNIVTGGSGNPVTFYYGKYFREDKHFCVNETQSNVVVDRNKIFIEKETMCSYETSPYEVNIDTTDLPILKVGNDQETKITYKGYTINYLNSASGILHPNIIDFNIIPNEWKKSDFSAVEIKAYVNVLIREIQASCPNPWVKYPIGYVINTSDYRSGDEVVYGINLYRCLKSFTTERPDQSMDWAFVRRCLLQVTKEQITSTPKLATECFAEDVWQPTLQDPSYPTIGTEVMYNGIVYESIAKAYPNHIPNLSPTIWKVSDDQCGDVGPTVTTFDLEYASAVFNVYMPQEDGSFTNLDSLHGISNNPIILESNYTINEIQNHGGTINNPETDIWEFIPENLLADKNTPDYTNLLLIYTDNNECIDSSNFPIYVDKKYNPSFNIVLNNINSKYCAIDENILFDGNNFTIDTLTGYGIKYNLADNNYKFNPKRAIDSTADHKVPFDINLQIRNNSYWYDTTYNVTVYPYPSIDNYQTNSVCYGDYVLFSGNPDFENTTDNLTWEWNFGDLTPVLSHTGVINNTDPIPVVTTEDITTGTYTNPAHKYPQAGIYNPTLKITSQDACSVDSTFNIIIGSYPKLKFIADGFIHNKTTNFENITSVEEFDPIDSLIWTFDDPGSINNMLIRYTVQPETHNFYATGVHNVTLSATSQNGCTSTDSIKVPIFDTINVSTSNPYRVYFNDINHAWIAAHEFDKGLPSGWELKTIEAPFISNSNGDGMIWHSGNPSDSIINEDSWVESPCFDISNLEFPLLSVDLYLSVEEGRDGAAIQYTLNDGETWNLLGDKDEGVNWYNTRGIVSNPGSQTETASIGWSLNNKKWETARYSLDNLKQQAEDSSATCIRFRVAYSSDAGNIAGLDAYGFAFDNFMLSSRSRVVMMEQFVNSAFDKNQQEMEEEWLDAFVAEKDMEVIDMRYHNYISHDYDPLFYINPPDISARAMEYGATMSQLTMVDGIYRCEANAELEATSYFQERTLTDKSFDIVVSTQIDGENLTITANITKLKDSLIHSVGSEKCVVRMAILQKEYTHEGEIYKNVLVELLPNGEGNVVATIPAELSNGETVTATGTWKPNVTTIDNEFRLVVYVQGIWGVDEIHQVWFKDLAAVPQVTVSAPVESLKTAETSFNIYPSPVKDQLNIVWSETLENPVKWKLVSTSGSIVKHGVTSAGNLKEQIDTYQINEGIYLLITEDYTSSKVEKRKILIMR